MLHEGEEIGIGSLLHGRDQKANEGVQLVNRPIALDPLAGLGDTLAPHQRGGSLIARSCINNAFLHLLQSFRNKLYNPFYAISG